MKISLNYSSREAVTRISKIIIGIGLSERQKGKYPRASLKGETIMKTSKLVFALAIAQTIGLFTASTALCQSTTSKDQITMAALEGNWGFGHN